MPGDFYFLKNKFYTDFDGCGLMPNKNTSDVPTNSRPCFFAFTNKANDKIYWFVPISSKVDKYEAIADKNVARYGRCDFLEFGEVLGHRTAFLIQNMFPATREYIADRYIHNDVVVRIDKITEQAVIKKAEDVLEKRKKGIKLTFTDIDKIYSTLQEQLEKKKTIKATKVEVGPLRIIGRTERGDVQIKLPGATPEAPKTTITLPKEDVVLDKDGQNVVGATLELQQKYKLSIPGGKYLRTRL